MKIAICEDSLNDRNLLYNLITKTIDSNNLEIRYEILFFTSGEDLITYYKDRNEYFDIIFLDIFMTNKNGIETARVIRKYDKLCKIIFTTSSTDYAFEGYSVFAYNYLVKPITMEKLKPIFVKAVEDIDIIRQKVLYVKIGTRIQLIPHNEIKYIESCGKKVKISSLHDGDITYYSKLNEIEATINNTCFLRTHKSFLVNMNYIISSDKYFFTLDDNTKIPIRQKKYSEITNAYYDFIFKMLDILYNVEN